MEKSYPLSALATLLLLTGCGGTASDSASVAPPPTTHQRPSSTTVKLPIVQVVQTPDFLLGKRLFRETRFGHFYMVNSNGNVNATLSSGEPLVNDEVNASGNPPTLPDPMKGTAVNCMQCHLGEQDANVAGGGPRVFNDFAVHSPIPSRSDDPLTAFTTPRNAPVIAGAMLHGDVDQVLHYDGQFGPMQDLVVGTLSGRNFGWLPTEGSTALHQVAQVIRGDNGQNALAESFSGGMKYADLFQCSNKVKASYRLSSKYCIELSTASDADVVNDVGAVMSAYLGALNFAKDKTGQYVGSPYDQFLIANGLPRSPAPGQTPIQYGAALLQELEALTNPKYINLGTFKYHNQRPFVFGPNELDGLKMFLRRPAGAVITPNEVATNVIGNCVACHAPPDFTDFRMHNTGSTQFEYEDVHGAGTFANLVIPDLTTRNSDPNSYLPRTPQHPNALEPFRRPADASQPGYTDLGVWNIFANPDFPDRQASLRQFLCAIDTGVVADCSRTDAQLLDRAAGVFRTKTVRDLDDSGPWLHSGHFGTLENVVLFYHHAGAFARGDGGTLRNPDPQMQNIALEHPQLPNLILFLQSLDEDFIAP
jgi:hypothetical protein